MPNKNNLYTDYNCNINQHCNNIANQYLVLVSIYAAIISQEIENDEDLGILGSFLITLGEELALASEIRIACKAKFEEESSILTETEDVFDRSMPRKNNSQKKFKKKKKHKSTKGKKGL